ncbi:MAG: hypothetical protein EBU36_01730 [Verrucomicrobia bacterium]|nr:hypothetical protein [Verrucomicrobiota bacterium]
MKKVKFHDGSYTILAIKSDLFAGEGDGVFDPDGNLLKARIRFPSGLARPVTRHGAAWNEIQAVGELRTAKRKTRTSRPKAVRKAPARKTPPPFEKPRGGRRISRREQYAHDFREEQKAIAARIRGEVYVPKRYPERTKPESGTYRSFGAWVAAVRRAGGTPNSELSEPQGAFNRSTGQMVGEWDGQSGMIIRRNPVKPRKGESERKFVSRCMSEEKESFPKLKQRIAVCLSKARKNPLLESGATISRNSGINRRAASMT